MNPVSLVLWLVPAGLLSLAPRFLLGWSWGASLVAGLVATPPLLWLLGALLDRLERSAPALKRPPLELPTPPPCPRCGSPASATLLYGLQAMTAELERTLADGRAVLAGCPVFAGAPRFLCRACGERHGRADPG